MAKRKCCAHVLSRTSSPAAARLTKRELRTRHFSIPQPPTQSTERKKELNHNVRINSSHHSTLPGAILPPDCPHPGQSAAAARRAGHHRRWWADQCLLEPRMTTLPHRKEILREQDVLTDTARTHTFSSTTRWRSSAKCRTT